MKDRKTKFIQKDRSVRKTQQRPQPFIPIGIRKRLYQEIKQINREETCPFLVRVFYAINDENHFKSPSDLPADRQIHLHLWMNSTLKEISELLRAYLPSIRAKQKFLFSKLTFNKQKKQFQKQQLGWVLVSKWYVKVEEKALCHTKFKIGDLIDVSITYK